jgi:hypothetical protein
MAITVNCPCGRQFQSKDSFAGRQTRCPGCGSTLTIPGAPASVPPPLPKAVPSPAQKAEWFYSQGDERLGPVTLKALEDLFASGELAPSDMVWKEGLKAWRPASTVLGRKAAHRRLIIGVALAVTAVITVVFVATRPKPSADFAKKAANVGKHLRAIDRDSAKVENVQYDVGTAGDALLTFNVNFEVDGRSVGQGTVRESIGWRVRYDYAAGEWRFRSAEREVEDRRGGRMWQEANYKTILDSEILGIVKMFEWYGDW